MALLKGLEFQSAEGVGMARMTGSEAIVRSLIEHGVETVFGLPGAQTYGFFDALYKYRDKIRLITSRHEQGSSYMAFGYAQSTGKPGVFCVVPGPGILNASAGLNTAWGAGVPVLAVVGQIPSDFIGKGRGQLHEMPDQLKTLRSFVKWSARIDDGRKASKTVNTAWSKILSGRQGPATIEMAMDVMMKEVNAPIGKPGAQAACPKPDAKAIEAAAKMVLKAKRPMIMVGGGAQHAGPAVLRLAELLDAPVTAFRRGRGVVSDDHPLGMNSAAAYELWPETDLLIGIGTRLELQFMRWAKSPAYVQAPKTPKIIRIDIDPKEMTRLKPHVGIVTDSVDGAMALADALEGRAKRVPRARARIAKAKASARAQYEAQVQPQVAYLDVIRDVMPRDGFFVEELSQVGFTSYYAYPVYEPRTYITTGFPGTLGFGFQTALGVKAGNPDRAVVSVTGDGGFMFGLPEMATAVQENLGLVTILFNNGGFGNVRRDQEIRFGGRLIGSELQTPDFTALARSFGMAAKRVRSPEELRPALKRALKADKPALIEVMIERGSEATPWPFIMPAGFGR
jgi:acetolactate synthase I/II/III large subunit